MISGLILAAGLSRRMGQPKQDIKLLGKPLLDYSVTAFNSSAVDEVIVVVNQKRTSDSPKVRFILNADPSLGISSSLRVGLGAIGGGSEAAVIGLGDKPLLLPRTIDAMVDTYRRTGSRIVIPVHRGIRGNPILFHRSIFPAILSLSGDVGAKQVIIRNEEMVFELEVDDDGVLLDVDTPSDFEKARETLESRLRHR